MKIFRKTVSLSLIFCFIYTAISSIGLEFSPHDKQAVWSFLGMTKPVLKHLHEIFGYGFLALSIFHIILNLKPIINYVKRAKTSLRPSKTAIVATMISSLIFVAVATTANYQTTHENKNAENTRTNMEVSLK